MDSRDHDQSAAAPIGARALMALTRPALAMVGDVVLDARQQVWLTELLDALSAVLTQGLSEGESSRRIELEWLTGGLEQEAPMAGFGFALASTEDSTAAIVTLDVPAARALVDVIESQLADLRGAGEITQTEHGLLEFTTLSALDELMSSPEMPKSRRWRSPGSSAAPTSSTRRRSRDSIRCGSEGGGGGAGRPRRDLDPGHARRPTPARGGASVPAVRSPSPAGDVEVMLTLPPVSLHRDAVEGLRAGDVLLLGATDLSSFGARCRLVTSNAWQLGSATVVSDAAERVTVRCGALALEVYQPPAAPDGSVAILPVFGSTSLTLDQVRRWPTEGTLDLVASSASPVDLLVDARWLASGELVRIDGELGVRVTQREQASPDHEQRDETQEQANSGED